MKKKNILEMLKKNPLKIKPSISYPHKTPPRFSGKSGPHLVGFSSPVLKNFKLKKFGGKNDLDFDGVINSKDCQPLNTMRQDFKPFKWQDASKLSAAKRFGGKNLSRLQKIGQGRDRTVYALDNDKVLKVAKNPGGLTQNTMESDLDYPTGQIKHYETGLDYAVMERAQPPGKATTKMLRPLKKARDEAGGFIMIGNQGKHPDAVRADFFNSPHFEESGLDASTFSSHSVNPSEFTAKRQWGEKDGQPVLIDGGALTSGPELRRHRVKDFQQIARMDTERDPPWQLEEWQEVQRQRKLYRDKGADRTEHYIPGERYDRLAEFDKEPEEPYSEKDDEFIEEQIEEIIEDDDNEERRDEEESPRD